MHDDDLLTLTDDRLAIGVLGGQGALRRSAVNGLALLALTAALLLPLGACGVLTSVVADGRQGSTPAPAPTTVQGARR